VSLHNRKEDPVFGRLDRLGDKKEKAMSVQPTDPVRRLMHGDVVCADLGASLRELAETMSEQEVGSVVVVEMSQVVGIVTERDVVMAIADGGNVDEMHAADIMSEGPICAGPDDTLQFTTARMIEWGVQHLPVIESGRAIGMVSARDVFKSLADHAGWAVAVETP
jgi:CBS domain-containing protein